MQRFPTHMHKRAAARAVRPTGSYPGLNRMGSVRLR